MRDGVRIAASCMLVGRSAGEAANSGAACIIVVIILASLKLTHHRNSRRFDPLGDQSDEAKKKADCQKWQGALRRAL